MHTAETEAVSPPISDCLTPPRAPGCLARSGSPRRVARAAGQAVGVAKTPRSPGKFRAALFRHKKRSGGFSDAFPNVGMGGSVPDYRVYQLNQGGHISEPPHVLTCKDDEEAQREARKLLVSQALEIWCGSHKVATIKPDV
jgi:hypothetical protein